MKSFAHCLKESSHDAGENSQIPAMLRLVPSPKATAPNARAERQDDSSDDALLGLLSMTVLPQQPQIADPRGLTLSLPMKAVSGDKGAKPNAPAIDPNEESPVPAAPVITAAPIAFGVTLTDAAAASTPADVKKPDIPGKQELATDAAAPENDATKLPNVSLMAPVQPKPANPASSAKDVESGVKPDTQVTPLTAAPVLAKPQTADTGHNGAQQDRHQDHDDHGKTDGVSASAAHRSSNNTRERDDEAAVPVDTRSITPEATVPVQTFAPNHSGTGPVQLKSDVAAVSSTQAVAEPPATLPLKPHAIDIRVGGPDSQGVDVRVSQRAGDVQVTVRTPDTGLAQSLRDHLPELSDRLSQTGVHNEIWQTTPTQTSADTGSQSGESSNTDAWRGQQQNQQQQQHQQQQADQQGTGQQNRDSRNWWGELNQAQKENA